MFARICHIAAALAVLLTSVPAAAQNVTMLPEHEVAALAYIAEHPLPSIELPLFEVALVEDVPELVELHTIEAPDCSYHYLTVNGQTVIVEPNTRKIVKTVP